MKVPLLSLLALAAVCALPARAQHHGAHDAPATQGAAPGPYAGMQQREIKALSAQQLADLRAGRGMSLALAAELNGYPGPAHVLELAGPLQLSPAQRARTQALFDGMQQEARAQGEALIAAERALDLLFKEQRATPEALAAAGARAAQAQGRLRESHLRYHLEMRELLTPRQVAAYQQLRGY